MPNAAPSRLFFALWPDAATAARLRDWTRAAHAACAGRPMRADTLHITLAFLGGVDATRTEELVAMTRRQRIAPGRLRISHYGVFARPRIVWAGPRPADLPALEALRDALWNALAPLGWPQPDQPYRPHVTLLRHADTSAALPAPPEPVDWTYDRFVLVRSDPSGGVAHYAELAATQA